LLIAMTTCAASAAETPVLSEKVTGGNLDLIWVPGFNTPVRTMQAATLGVSDPAYANPSGDHTVAVATNTVPDSGGIILTCTDPGPFVADSAYVWEGWVFTGAGNTRRGLVVRADPTNSFQNCYQFVVQAGLLQINFRKLIGQVPTTLGSWFSSSLPAYAGGTIPQNRWIHLKVRAANSGFRCWLDGYELTGGTTIVDAAPLPSGWVGAYNFRFDVGLVPVYFDDLTLSVEIDPTPSRPATWGAVKARYR
jgi:hypothetical protein